MYRLIHKKINQTLFTLVEWRWSTPLVRTTARFDTWILFLGIFSHPSPRRKDCWTVWWKMGILGCCVYQCFCNFIDSSLFNGWISISNYYESPDGFRSRCDISSNECFNFKMGPRRRKINYFINYLWRNFIGQEISIVESLIAKKEMGLLGSLLKSVNSNVNQAVPSSKLGRAKTHFLSHFGEKIWLDQDLNPWSVDQKLIVLTITP